MQETHLYMSSLIVQSFCLNAHINVIAVDVVVYKGVFSF